MKGLIKKSLAVMTSGAIALSLVACGSDENKPANEPTNVKQGVTITIGMKATHVEISSINYHKEQWEKMTGNKIEIQAVDDNQFEQLLLTKMTSGGMWDLFVGDTGAQATKYKHADNLVDLSDEPWASNLSEVGKGFVTVDGKIYTFPNGGINSFAIGSRIMSP